MTNPTLERAARALHTHWLKNFDHGGMHADQRSWDDLAPEAKAYGIGQARAVMMAVREPDEEFMLALYPDPESISADRGKAAGERSRRAGRMQIDHFIRAILAEGE